jgi:hypothetical protein
MTNDQNQISGECNLYNKYVDYAGQRVIRARVSQGAEYILLRDLYSTLGAETASDKNSIQWSVRHAKDAGIISKIKGQRGVYRVVV